MTEMTLNEALEDIARAKAEEVPLTSPIEGYQLMVVAPHGLGQFEVARFDLKLSRVGGAHVTNKESLIQMIEDAVFINEKEKK